MNNVVLPQTIEEESTKVRSNAYGMRDYSLTGESAMRGDKEGRQGQNILFVLPQQIGQTGFPRRI